MLLFFFFFQAEDGIRDKLVTGVQTCALPIYLKSPKLWRSLEIPKNSSEILIRPGGDIAYISGTGDGKIAVLDLRSWNMQSPIELTPGVDGLAWFPFTRSSAPNSREPAIKEYSARLSPAAHEGPS